MQILPASFTERLIQINHLTEQGFQAWHWQQGMLFAADRNWWGAAALRPRPHEGLDLSTFINSQGDVVSLAAGALIPALFGGQVVAIFADFLGQSILVAHQQQQGEGRWHSLYAHVVPEPGVAVGSHWEEGAPLARIAKSVKSGVPAHLHLSTLWLSGALDEGLSWPKLSHFPSIDWCDPRQFINR